MKNLIKLLKASGVIKDEWADRRLEYASKEDLKPVETKSDLLDQRKLFELIKAKPGIPFADSPRDFARVERKIRRR